jgi:hypothetical protein
VEYAIHDIVSFPDLSLDVGRKDILVPQSYPKYGRRTREWAFQGHFMCDSSVPSLVLDFDQTFMSPTNCVCGMCL